MSEQPSPRRRIRYLAVVIIAALTAVLGFAIAVQLKSQASPDSLSNLREDDLIRILDDQNARAQRLQQQIADLRTTLAKLQASGGRDAAARAQADEQTKALGILLGTLPATGPGVEVLITDPAQTLKAEDLLDVVQELRGAGAEAIQFGGVRIGASSSFQDAPDGLHVDATLVRAPYRVLAIGDPSTLDTALNIPGGVAATVRAGGGDASVSQRQDVVVSAVRAVATPKYATPAPR